MLSNENHVRIKMEQFKITNTQLKKLEQDYEQTIATPRSPNKSHSQTPPKTVMALHSQLTSLSSTRISFTSLLSQKRMSSSTTYISNPPSPDKSNESMGTYEKLKRNSGSSDYTDIDDAQKSPDTTRQATTASLHFNLPIDDQTYMRRSITASQNYF